MQASLQTCPEYAELVGDVELARIFGHEAELRALIAVEVALAQAQSELGLIPAEAGARIAQALAGISVQKSSLQAGIALSGVPIPPLLAQLRAQLPAELAHWLHWGATSQDIVDSAAVVQIGQCLTICKARLSALIDGLQGQSLAHEDTLMAGRTRTQFATPTTLALRIAQWAQPLIAQENTYAAMRKHALRLQLGGAVGANAVIAPYGPDIARLMAERLQLQASASWHTDRSGIIGVANWLLQISQGLSKLGKDLMLQSRSEIGELRAGALGGSSTMPNKANPVQSEIIVAMGQVAQSLHSGLCAAASPIEERDGASWTLEWILLPQLFLSVGCALRHALVLAQTLSAEHDKMAGFVRDHSTLMAEAASFHLAQFMPRPQAQARVKQAAQMGQPLSEALSQVVDETIDWPRVLDPKNVIAPCRQMSRNIFAQRIDCVE